MGNNTSSDQEQEQESGNSLFHPIKKDGELMGIINEVCYSTPQKTDYYSSFEPNSKFGDFCGDIHPFLNQDASQMVGYNDKEYSQPKACAKKFIDTFFEQNKGHMGVQLGRNTLQYQKCMALLGIYDFLNPTLNSKLQNMLEVIYILNLHEKDEKEEKDKKSRRHRGKNGRV